MYENDKAILTEALEMAATQYKALRPAPTLAGADPKQIVDTLSAAVATCETYKAIAGFVVFSGGSGPVLDSFSLASRLFSKGVRFGNDIAGAIDWLIRLMTTRQTAGLFKAVIWGLSLGQDAALTDTSRLLPFEALPDSYMRRRILERAKRCYDGSAWMTQSYFDAPTAAFVREIPDFPYIRDDNAAFLVMEQSIWDVHELSILVQGACIGHPMAVACWFEYADPELEFAAWENNYTWLLPEIHPHVKNSVPADISVIQTSLASYDTLPDEQRTRLFRSMERFRLSQSRRETIDRILDLALAFEIAVSERGDNAPPGWKVSVRSAQVIGGPLLDRQKIRAKVSALYDLRNQATHGGTLRAKSADKSVEDILRESFDLYVVLMKRLLGLRAKPDWKALELGPA
jgi:hypothetical protein